MDWWNAVLPVVTLALGWVGSVKTEERRHARERAAEKEDRDDARALAREDRREDFELNTLRDLYSALTRHARSHSRYHPIDLRVAREHSRPYGSFAVEGTDDLAEEMRLGTVEVRALTDLVLDDQIRARVKEASVGLAELAIGPKTIEQAEEDFDDSVRLLSVAQRHISRCIREIYKSETAR